VILVSGPSPGGRPPGDRFPDADSLMKRIGIAVVLLSSFCYARNFRAFELAPTNSKLQLEKSERA